MHSNIEIKVAVPDLGGLRERARALGADWAWTRRQRDVFFRVPRGYLKLRVSEGEPGELIAYEREAGSDPRPSRYAIAPVPDPAAMEEVLARALPRLGVVMKIRELHRWRHTRIHLDRVERLGTFLELETLVESIGDEAARSEAEEAITFLELDRSAFLDRPYLELLPQPP